MKSLVFLICLMASLFANKMQVFQPPTSTCPKSWFEQMKKVANEVEVITIMNVKNLKQQVGVPKQIQSCNTSLMEDFVFEGNVPLKAIKDFLKMKPKGSIGLALPASQNDRTPKTVYIIYEDKTYKEFGKY